MRSKDTKEKIILSTIRCIEKKGFQEVTIRDIAKEANINIALVNYHFGSKNKLMERVLKYTVNQAFSDIEAKKFYNSDKNDLFIEMEKYFFHFIDGAIKYPSITRAHIYRPFILGDYRCDALKLLGRFMRIMVDKIRSFYKVKKEKNVEFIVMQIISCIVLPAMFSEFFKESLGVDLKEDKVKREYIKSVIRKVKCLSQIEAELK